MRSLGHHLAAFFLAILVSGDVAAQVPARLIGTPGPLFAELIEAVREDRTAALETWFSRKAWSDLQNDSVIRGKLAEARPRPGGAWQTKTSGRTRLFTRLDHPPDSLLEIAISGRSRKIVFLVVKEFSHPVQEVSRRGRAPPPQRGSSSLKDVFSFDRMPCTGANCSTFVTANRQMTMTRAETARQREMIEREASGAVRRRTGLDDFPTVIWPRPNFGGIGATTGSAKTEPVPPPASPVGASDPPAGTVPPTDVGRTDLPVSTDPQIVRFYYSTTRRKGPGAPIGQAFTRARSDIASYGTVEVRIPEDHRFGQVERPRDKKLLWFITLERGKEEERQHFILKSVSGLTKDDFVASIASQGRSDALVFVHGFNNSFEDASYRAAQIFYDLQFEGVPVLFSWASGGGVADYGYDKESAYLARRAFIDLLETLKGQGNVKRIHVLAHSMGNLVVLDSLWNNARTRDPVKIDNLVMAAPDVDSDQFRAMMPDLGTVVAGATLYASSADKALTLSKSLVGGVPRAGDVPPSGPIVLPGVETVDVTAIGDEMFGLNHNVFATTRSVINDLRLLLAGLKPPRLSEVRGYPTGKSPPSYWRFVP